MVNTIKLVFSNFKYLILSTVQYNNQQAREHGVRGTPGFFIVGPDSQEQLGGAQPFSVFKQVMDSMI